MSFFSFNVAAITGIYTLSLHDALPILIFGEAGWVSTNRAAATRSFAAKVAGYGLIGVLCAGFAGAWAVSYQQNNELIRDVRRQDRKSTRLNSSHSSISYAVFCLKKKKK